MSFSAYWITPNGKIIGVSRTHIDSIIDSPSTYGLNKSTIINLYNKFGEKIGQEGNAREKLMVDLIKKGWIRIRNVKNRGWYLEADNFNRATKNKVFDFIDYGLKYNLMYKHSPITVGLLDGKIKSSEVSDFLANELDERKLNEDPDSFHGLNANKTKSISSHWTASDARPFGYYKNKLYVSESEYEDTHGNLFSLKDTTSARRGEHGYKWFGRIWINTKVISFWQYPRTKTDLMKVVKDLERDLDIKILGRPGWLLNTSDEKLIDLNYYLGSSSRQDIENRKNFSQTQLHTMSPMLKPKQKVPVGWGSKKYTFGMPSGQYAAMVGIAEDKISLKEIVNEVIKKKKKEK